MRPFIFRCCIVFIMSLPLVCCTESFPSRYVLQLPHPPGPWVSILGEPDWHLEWLDKNGQRQTAEIKNGESPEIELPITWANPVIAWPHWPDFSLIPGHFMPAGALFPFDAAGGYLMLSWAAGLDVIFYKELALANDGNTSRLPAYFDWLRFRDLFETEILNETILMDPWLIDWRSIAERTVNSGFDRRRLVSQPVKLMNIPMPCGNWYGSSPFAEPLFFAESEDSIFPLVIYGQSDKISVWISDKGILRCTAEAWVFSAF